MENMAKHYIHEIPEGYEARIEGNKVIIDLRESEDEKIRKHLVAIVEMYWGKTNDPDKAKELAYLKKQKDKMTAEEFESSELFQLKLKTKYANGYQDGLAQKEQKPEEKPINWTELTWKDINKLEGIINNVHYEFRNGIGQESFGKEVLEKFREYKGDEYLDEIEQKPNSTEDMYIADEHFYERTPADSFKYKLAEYMTKNYRKAEGPYGHTYLISAETILEMAEEELLKRGVVQKPAEWSDEECGRLFDIEHYLDGTLQLSPDRKIACIVFLKSLCPSWKPSEEDLMMLEHIIEQYETGNKNSKVMGYLPRVEELNFLKKVFEIWKN